MERKQLQSSPPTAAHSTAISVRSRFSAAFSGRRALEAVLDEIEQIRQLGYDNLWIGDDSFTLDPTYLKNFCKRMAGRKMTWSCLSRVTGIDLETSRIMKEGGCRKVYLGLETGSPETLRLMNKKATVDEGVKAVHLFHEAGIEVAAFFIVGLSRRNHRVDRGDFPVCINIASR